METKKKSFKEWIKWITDFLFHDIFRITENELSKTMRFFVRLLKKLILSIRGFFEDKLMIKAAALTYYTALAIVPIFALILAIGSGFGFKDIVETFVISLLGENEEFTPMIMNFVTNYLQQTKGGIFVGFGIGVLLWAVISMFRQIETNFNSIWNVKKNRSLLKQFTTYITIMIVAPILIVISSGLNVKVDEYVDVIATSSIGTFFIPIYQFLVKLAPFVIYWILFTLVYLIIPNTKVKVTHAMFSGIITGTVFLFLQFLYVTGQVSLTKYNAVYGSFAAIPMLLFWLQLSWVIVLYGAEFCYISQNLTSFSFESDTNHISQRYKDYTLLIVLKLIVDKFAKAEKAISANQISITYNIPLRLVDRHLKLLMDTNLITEVDTDKDEEEIYQPAMDINLMTLKLVLERIRCHGSEKFKIRTNDEFQKIWIKLENLQNTIDEQSQNILIKDL